MGEIEFTNEFEEWWQTLTEQEQDDATAIIELLGENGVRRRFPYSSGVKGSDFPEMRELRIQSHGNPFRIFYAFDQRHTAVL
ncbi:MAG: type II toxin-antitoxin system RelE/ParE family toxin [Nitrospiraceae bacterium]|nr:type II toxin-antitoxin system RelE/ParE family toxin [Nitrospiraceae bacterium]